MEKKILVVNGAEKLFIYDPEHDSLADLLRRAGLTGTKIGCGAGMCGACNVILNGELVRSCVRKAAKVTDYSTIITIEGLGTADKLHPLQLSWIVHGGVQCGFCTPGFIVSAKALLASNPNPSRTEVRDWFKKHRNACRCTGYKPLVDAVMDAAKVLRGELTCEELAWKMPADGKIYNTDIPRPAALGKVLGACDFGDDIALKMPADTLELALVLPQVSHARIINIDISAAQQAPGVFKVITAKDVRGTNRIAFPLPHPRALCDGAERPILMDEKIFRAGDPVAVVAADSRRHAREAAKLVKIEFEQLPEYLEGLDAMADDAIQIHPGTPNIFITHPLLKGEDTREVLADSQHVVTGSFYSSREPHLVIEPDVAQAYPTSDGGVTIHSKSLFLHMIIWAAAEGIGLPPDKIRCVENPTGASFGYSMSPGTAALVAVCALACDRPVNLTLSYPEYMLFTGKRAPSYSNARLGATAEGKITGLEYEIAFEKGAYSEVSDLLVEIGQRFFGTPYSIPNITGLSKLTFSNHAFSTAYRGFGSPQCYTGMEALMDMMAEELGLDPFEFRYRNIYRPGDVSNTGEQFDVYPMEALMDAIRPRYEALRAHAATASTPERPHGVGFACGMYNVSGTNDRAEADIELMSDGSITVYNTWEDQGQGADVGSLIHAHEAFREVLGLQPEQIHLVMNDTALAPVHGPAGASRSHYMGGNALLDARDKLVAAMTKPDGTLRTYDEMQAEGLATRYRGVTTTDALTDALNPNTGRGKGSPEYTYCVYACEVEVDIASGKTTVVALHCVSDLGIVGNYLAVDGQAYGGMEHSRGFALREDFSDSKKHTTMAGAGFTYIDMIPDGEDFTTAYIETPRPSGPQGSSGCSEAFQSGGHMAVISAIKDATGVRIFELPATPEKVKAALEAQASGEEKLPEPYYLGADFWDVIEEIRANPVNV
ncbi:MAG: molybdopterin-dependent oxidoreductase [Coriobacteriales bacterium]|jgi:aldehyde oxidoreductase|nr:molybdopterin-dependent oxidoreductase [Coriobacteriales bacterium]